MDVLKGSADPQPDPESDLKILRRHVDELMEHFDTVRIFVTRHSDGTSRCITHGNGNRYATEGAVREWMVEQDERTRLWVRDQDED